MIAFRAVTVEHALHEPLFLKPCWAAHFCSRLQGRWGVKEKELLRSRVSREAACGSCVCSTTVSVNNPLESWVLDCGTLEHAERSR